LEASVPLFELLSGEYFFECLAELFVFSGDLGFDLFFQGIQSSDGEFVRLAGLLKLVVAQAQFIAQTIRQQLSLGAW
jgi:hypothetical protein